MKILRKSMTLLLTLALVITMMPVGASYAFGAESSTAASAGGNAFAAIGIDTSVAPDGVRCRQHRQPVRKRYD